MALLRKFRRVDRDLRRTGWLAGREHAASGNDLSGRTIGIVGFGAVGRHVADIAAKGFGLDVIVNSRTPGICLTMSASLRWTSWSRRATSSCSAAR